MWRGPPRCLLAKPSGRAAGLTLGGVVLTVNGDGALVERQLAGGAGHRTMGAGLGRPASTVRGWLRRFAARAEQVRVFFTVLLARTSPDPVMPAGAAGPVAAAVSAVAGAAAAVAQRWPAVGAVPVWAAASAASGGLLLAPGWPPAGRHTS